MKRLAAILVAALAAVAGWAQSTIKVEVHNIVELSERFNVVFVVEGEHAPSDFSWTPGEDFTLVWGPQKGTSSSISIVNGKTTRSSQTSYTYILQAKKTGTFTFPFAVAKVKGDEIRSHTFQVQVVDNGAKGATSGSQAQSSEGTASATPSASSDDIFMRFSLSRTSAVVGEPVQATLKIYQNANLVGFENAKFPSFSGFWSQEVDTPSNIEFHREQVDGKIYNAAVLRRWVLIPQKAGDLVIDPSEIVCLVNVRSRRQGTGSIFDDFFENDYVTTRRRVYTPSSTVHVSALPAGAPASFGGGVGDFNVSARLSKDSLKTHDAASLVVTLSGKGNVSLLDAPKVSFPPDFEVYDVKTTVQADKSGTNGSKTFEYPFIPRSPGEFVLPPVRYSYYNVNTHRYVTVSTDSLFLNVARTASAATPVSEGSTLVVDRKGVKNLGEDIRFIRTRTALGEPREFLVGKPVYGVIALLLVLLAAGAYFAFRRVAARRSDVAGTRNRKAAKIALKRLSTAGDFLKKNLYTAFYEELHRSLLGYVSDKLSLDLADQNKENIAASLGERGVPEEVVKDFTDLVDACEYARYAPDAGHDAMNAHYEKAVSVITALEGSMKKPVAAGRGSALAALLIVLLPFAARGAESYPDSLWRAGVDAYSAGDYASALQDWEGVRDCGLSSKELCYNLGNAYFKNGEIAPAILWYERALRLDPSDADIRYNLAFAQSQTQDRIDTVPEFFLKTWARKVSYLFRSDVWAVLSLLLLAVTLSLVLLFLLGSSSRARKTGFFCGIVTLLLTLLCWGAARSQRSDALRQDRAVVMRAVSSVKSSPSADGAKDLFILHEGTCVRVRDAVSGYSLVELSDGRQGWMPSADLEII